MSPVVGGRGVLVVPGRDGGLIRGLREGLAVRDVAVALTVLHRRGGLLVRLVRLLVVHLRRLHHGLMRLLWWVLRLVRVWRLRAVRHGRV